MSASIASETDAGADGAARAPAPHGPAGDSGASASPFGPPRLKRFVDRLETLEFEAGTELRVAIERFAAQVLERFSSPLYRWLLRRMTGSGGLGEPLAACFQDLCEARCAFALQKFLATQPLGRDLGKDRRRELCLDWVRLLRILAAPGARPFIEASELAALLIMRVDHRFVPVVAGAPQAASRNGRAVAGEPGAEAGAAGPRGEVACRRGILTVSREAVRIDCSGERLPLSPAEARILAFLVEHGSASWSQLAALLRNPGERSRPTLRVFIHRLRAKLRDAEVPVALTALRGSGVALVPIEDERADPMATLMREAA